MSTPWFIPMRYGAGVVPASPKGWALLVAFIVLEAVIVSVLIAVPLGTGGLTAWGTVLGVILLGAVAVGFVWLARRLTRDDEAGQEARD